jgi:hypothetical protein
MRKLAVLAGAIALTAGLGACSSSGSSTSSSTATAAPKSGTETIAGKITGAAAMANNPVFPLTFSGPVKTSASQKIGGTPKKGQAYTFTTAAGNYVVTLTTVTSTQKIVNAAACRFAFGTAVTYTVDGSKSTGKFAGATGSGKAAVVFEATTPKLSDGKCNTSSSAQPLSTPAPIGTFTAAGPLTLK